MKQTIQCPGCQTALEVDLEPGNTQFLCPKCQFQFHVAPPSRAHVADPPSNVANPSAPQVGVKTRRPVRRRKKSSLPMILTLAALAGLTGLLGGYAYHVHQQRSQEARRRQAQAEADAAQRASEQANAPVRDPSPVPAPPPDPQAQPEPDGSDLEMPTPPPEPPPADQNARLLESLAQFGGQCEVFQFLPENETQYQQLQAFVLTLSKVESRVIHATAKEMESNDRDALQSQFTQWQSILHERIEQVASEAPERLLQLNGFAENEFEKTNSLSNARSFVIFYGMVFLKADEVTNAIVKFDRKQVYFSIPNMPELETTRDEIYRLFLVETPETPHQTVMNSPGGGLIHASAAKLIDVFDPLNQSDSTEESTESS